MLDDLGRLPTGAAVAATAYAIGLVATLAEVGWLARRPGAGRRAVLADALTASIMLAGSLVAGILYTALFVALWSLAGDHRPPAAAGFWADHPVVATTAALVLWDACFWVYHAIGHVTAVGWASHAPHHSGRSYDLTLGLRQPWFPFHGLLVWPWIALTGLPFDLVVAVGAVATVWQLLVHTAAPFEPPRWFAAVVVTPGAHRRHHDAAGAPVNLGGVLTVWDRLAGTWAGQAIGMPTRDDRDPTPVDSALRVELRPWLDLRHTLRPGATTGGRATTATVRPPRRTTTTGQLAGSRRAE